MHDHHHGHHNHDISGRKLLLTALLNIVITIAEFIGALFSGSLALLSDATHNFGDTLSVIAAYIANKIGKKEANLKKTFGYKRIEIITAFFNALSLLIITFFIFHEAFNRLQHPQIIESKTMMIVAIIGLLANILGAALLHHDSKKNINIKASYLHLISDAFSSVLVILGAIIIHQFHIYWIDSIFGFAIGLFILWNVYFILKNTLHILMQSTPLDIDINKICQEIETLQEIKNVHHVHAWSLDEHHHFFECHICTKEDFKLSQTQGIIKQAEHILKEHYGFTHITIQIEFSLCEDHRIIQ